MNMNIEFELHKGDDSDDSLNGSVSFPVVPRIGEVIWLHNNKRADDIKDMFSTTAFIVDGVYYHFYDNAPPFESGAYITAKPFNP